MKKLISYLLIFAILVGCMASAAAVSAVDVTLAAESVEKVEGSGTAVAPKLTIAGNPGLSYVRLVVYYDSSELALGDTADSLADSVFSADDSEVSKEYAGTHRNVRDHIPEELRDMSNGFFVELCGAGEETVYGDGIAVEIPFEIIASDPGEFNYTVAVAEALDADGNDIALEGVSAAVSYVADPLTGIHDEFTVFMDPAIAEVTVGTTSIDVDIRLDQNPGLWATRIYIVYPEALTLADADGNARVENSFMIFEGAGEMLPGLPDLALDDPRQPATFEKVMRSDPSIVKEGYHSTTVYFESETVDTVADADGVLCTLSFSVSDSVKDGDALDISMYYGDSDFLYAYTDDGTGFPVFVEYSPAVIGSDITFVSVICDHVEGDAIITDPTCTEPGMIVHKCTLCGLIVRREYISATGHDRNGDVVTVEPTCVKDGTKTTYCSICGEVSAIEIIEALGSHTPGADATCTEPQLCLVCSSVIKAPLGHTEGEAVVIEPTCTLEGEETFYCTVCSVHTRTEIIPPKGHTVILGTCTVCGETELVPRELIYTVSNGAVTVTGYTGEESKLYIPATIEGYPVSTVADTLYKSSSIKSIYLSENIESLVLSVSGSAKLESLYISGADTTIRIQGSYTSSSGISNVFYAGTLAEYSSNMGAVNYFTNVICNYGTPMEGFIFTTDEDARSITVTGYNGLLSELVIPAEYRGYRVIAIDVKAFAGRTDITSISIPGTVEFIEEGSFEGCTGLRNVIFGEGICEIGDYAFSGCTSLESVILPESVVYVWAYAFNKCTSLVSVYLPSALAAIEYKAFYRCENICSVVYNGSPAEFGKVYMGNGNDPITMCEIEYLEEDEVKIVSIPVPEGMDPEDCRLYYVDENGNATELFVECVDGHFVVVSQATGYYIVRDVSEEAVTVTGGDVDGDGRITAIDANRLQRIISGIVEVKVGTDEYRASDVNGDGEINIMDENLLKRILAGVITPGV